MSGPARCAAQLPHTPPPPPHHHGSRARSFVQSAFGGVVSWVFVISASTPAVGYKSVLAASATGGCGGDILSRAHTRAPGVGVGVQHAAGQLHQRQLRVS